MFSSNKTKQTNKKKPVGKVHPVVDLISSEYPMHGSTASKRNVLYYQKHIRSRQINGRTNQKESPVRHSGVHIAHSQQQQ